jgi:hypothetical protein
VALQDADEKAMWRRSTFALVGDVSFREAVAPHIGMDERLWCSAGLKPMDVLEVTQPDECPVPSIPFTLDVDQHVVSKHGSSCLSFKMRISLASMVL